MPKRQTITVNQLHRMLGKLIDKGEGRTQVCVNKTTFRDNRESDGVTILPVDGIRIERVLQADDDGGTKTTQAGLEVSKRTCVLFGQSGTGFSGVLSCEAVDEYIKSLKWHDATDESQTLVAGNIRGFASYLRTMVG